MTKESTRADSIWQKSSVLAEGDIHVEFVQITFHILIILADQIFEKYWAEKVSIGSRERFFSKKNVY